MDEQKWRMLSLEEAQELARKWLEKLQTCCCDRVDIVAGVYRKKAQNRDVDLVCSTRSMEALRSLGAVKEDAVRIVFNDEGRRVEVWHTPPATYDLIKWFRRLEAKDFIQLASRAKGKGYKLSWRQGLLKDGKLVTSNPERIEEILK